MRYRSIKTPLQANCTRHQRQRKVKKRMPLNTKTPEFQVSLSSAYSCSMGNVLLLQGHSLLFSRALCAGTHANRSAVRKSVLYGTHPQFWTETDNKKKILTFICHEKMPKAQLLHSVSASFSRFLPINFLSYGAIIFKGNVHQGESTVSYVNYFL